MNKTTPKPPKGGLRRTNLFMVKKYFMNRKSKSPLGDLGVNSGRAGERQRGTLLRHSDMSDEILDSEAYRDGSASLRIEKKKYTYKDGK